VESTLKSLIENIPSLQKTDKGNASSVCLSASTDLDIFVFALHHTVSKHSP
jgi:hypothetical protein